MVGDAGGTTMGTQWAVRAVGLDAADICAAAEPLFARVIAQMSQWEPASDLSRFAAAPVGAEVALPADFAHVIATALAHADASSGAFDPACGTLSALWGFGPAGVRKDVPNSAAIVAARAAAGHDALAFDGVRLRRTRAVQLDLAGIAKGHAVDAVADALAARGCRDCLVEIGGEFVGRGLRPNGQPWWVDVEPVPGRATPPLRIAAHEVAVATSGDYRRFVAAGGRRWSHSIDPSTGHPIAHGTCQVSVIAGRCIDADAWATTLTVLPAAEAQAFATDHGIAARIVGDGVWHSPALRAMFE